MFKSLRKTANSFREHLYGNEDFITGENDLPTKELSDSEDTYNVENLESDRNRLENSIRKLKLKIHTLEKLDRPVNDSAYENLMDMENRLRKMNKVLQEEQFGEDFETEEIPEEFLEKMEFEEDFEEDYDEDLEEDEE